MANSEKSSRPNRNDELTLTPSRLAVGRGRSSGAGTLSARWRPIRVRRPRGPRRRPPARQGETKWTPGVKWDGRNQPAHCALLSLPFCTALRRRYSGGLGFLAPAWPAAFFPLHKCPP